MDVTFDASLPTYIGTANSLRGVGEPLLTRMEVFVIEPPDRSESVGLAQAIARETLSRVGLADALRFERSAITLLAHFSPRQMTRMAEKGMAAAVAAGRDLVSEDMLLEEWLGGRDARLH